MTRKLATVVGVAAAMVLGTVALPRAAAAARQKVVLFPVVALGGEAEPESADSLTKAIIEELALSGGLTIIPASLAVAAPAETSRRPARSDKEYRRALVDLKDGAKHARRLRLPKAIRSLRKGIDTLQKNLDLLEDHDRLIDAYLLLSEAYFRRGKEAAGTDLLETVARLKPDAQLDPQRYPPMFLSVFERSRARATARERGSIRVTSEPQGAEVVLNGQIMGNSPILITDVLPGKNHVVVRHGSQGWARRVDVSAGGVAERHANFGAGAAPADAGIGAAVAANRFDRQVRKAARNQARALGGAWVVVLAMGRGQGVYAVGGFLGNARTGKWVALDPIAPDFDLLSASIEAHSLGRNIEKHTGSFSPDVGKDTLAFIAGKRVQRGRSGVGTSEARVAFAKAAQTSARAPVRGAVTSARGRGPVVASREQPRTARTGPAGAPRSAVRGPIVPGRFAAEPKPPKAVPSAPVPSSPVAAAPKPRPAAPAPPPVPVRRPPVVASAPPPPAAPSRAPVGATRSTAPAPVAAHGRGPVIGAEGRLVDATDAPYMGPTDYQGSEGQGTADSNTLVYGGRGPLAPPMHIDESASVGSRLMRSGWFWTAVGGVAVAAGYGAWALFLADSQTDEVRVEAVWK